MPTLTEWKARAERAEDSERYWHERADYLLMLIRAYLQLRGSVRLARQALVEVVEGKD
jgi:hypothetical protein